MRLLDITVIFLIVLFSNSNIILLIQTFSADSYLFCHIDEMLFAFFINSICLCIVIASLRIN